MLGNFRFNADYMTPHFYGTSPVEIWTTMSFLQIGAAPTTNATLTSGTLYAVPFFSGRGGNIDRIAIEVTTVGGAGSKTRFGIYTSTSQSNLYPKSLIVDSGEFDTSATGGTGVKSTNISIELKPNSIYWAVMLCGTAAPTIRVPGASGAALILGMPSTLATVLNQKISVAQAYAALPSTFPAGGAMSSGLIGVWMRWSS